MLAALHWQLAKVKQKRKRERRMRNGEKSRRRKWLMPIKVVPKNARKCCHLWQGKAHTHPLYHSLCSPFGGKARHVSQHPEARPVSRLSKCAFCRRLLRQCPRHASSLPPSRLLYHISCAFEYMKFIFELLTSFVFASFHLPTSAIYPSPWALCVPRRMRLIAYMDWTQWTPLWLAYSSHIHLGNCRMSTISPRIFKVDFSLPTPSPHLVNVGRDVSEWSQMLYNFIYNLLRRQF